MVQCCCCLVVVVVVVNADGNQELRVVQCCCAVVVVFVGTKECSTPGSCLEGHSCCCQCCCCCCQQQHTWLWDKTIFVFQQTLLAKAAATHKTKLRNKGKQLKKKKERITFLLLQEKSSSGSGHLKRVTNVSRRTVLHFPKLSYN